MPHVFEKLPDIAVSLASRYFSEVSSPKLVGIEPESSVLMRKKRTKLEFWIWALSVPDMSLPRSDKETKLFI